MAEIPFRILLDFRELNFKFYKFVWMSISPRELVTIKDLKAAILKKFSFERTDLLLYLRDGLLPEDENISNILRENDSVRLFYTEPCIVQEHSKTDLNDARTFSYEGVEESSNADQVKSPRKRKEHSDSSEDNNEQIESNKKRKHSFSNGSYLFNNNSTPENSALISTVSGIIENATNTDLRNLENVQSESCKIKKKLKYSHDVSQNSLVSENEMVFTSDIPIAKRNESKINSCKKKKKHKHSKDASENEIAFYEDIVRMSDLDENKSRSHKKKKKYKHSQDSSKVASVSESAVSFHDETIDRAEKKNSVNDLESRNEVLKSCESIFQTVINNSELFKQAPLPPFASSINTSSGIGHSLKTSQESNQKISSEQNCNKYVSDNKPVSKMDENNLSLGQGNNCKKKKRKRHRKKKSLLTTPEVDVSNDCNLDMVSPQENVNSDSLFQTPGISPRSKEFTDSSKSYVFYPKKKSDCSQIKSSFVEPFGSYLPSTSTPFSQTHAASPRKNVTSKLPNSSIASEDQSCSKSLNTILPIIQKTMNENFLSGCSSPCSVTKNKKNTTVPSHSFYEKNSSARINDSNKSADSESIVKAVNSQTDEIEIIEPEAKEDRNGKFGNLYEDEMPSCDVIEKNENYLSACSSPCSVTKNKKNTIVTNDNFHERNSSTKINNSDKSTNSFSNVVVKSRFLDPSFSYKGCPPLNSCPLVGTRIAYKILELDASYSPVVSNYKEGVVKAVNSKTDELEIALIEPEVKEGRIGKFENIYEDELPSCEVIRRVILSWSSLIDPVRVIY